MKDLFIWIMPCKECWIAWGVKRSGRKIDAAMDEVLYQLTENGKVIKRGNFSGHLA